MNKKEIILLSQNVLFFAQKEQDNLVKKYRSEDDSIAVIIKSLNTVNEWVKEEWPISEEKKNELNMSVFAARNLIPDFMELASDIMDLEYFLENPQATEIPLL